MPDLIILDIWLQGSTDDGLQILEKLKKSNPHLPVLMISGHGTIETAVAAIKQGAYDFIEKPFKSNRLLLMIERALETASLRRENESLKKRTDNIPEEFVSASTLMQSLDQAIKRAAPSNSRIFLTGEPGSGKSFIARYIHARSRRADKPFMSLNCGAYGTDRLETELFGIAGGANGESGSPGILELAQGGTLHLNEIADMPLETQGKLLRVLQDETYQRVGDTRRFDVDVRIIASTGRDLEKEMNEGRFRQDLYYRLKVVPLHVPSLRERTADIPDLSTALMQSLARQSGIQPRPFSARATALLQSYSWPGNIRQLRNVLEWIAIMSAGAGIFDAEHLPPELTGQVREADDSLKSLNFLRIRKAVL
jgi:two-component system nitrogen regulation response regulator NtrX